MRGSSTWKGIRSQPLLSYESHQTELACFRAFKTSKEPKTRKINQDPEVTLIKVTLHQKRIIFDITTFSFLTNFCRLSYFPCLLLLSFILFSLLTTLSNLSASLLYHSLFVNVYRTFLFFVFLVVTIR